MSQLIFLKHIASKRLLYTIYDNKLDNLEEAHLFLEFSIIPKLNYNEIENQSRQIRTNKIEIAFSILLPKTSRIRWAYSVFLNSQRPTTVLFKY